MKRKEIYTYEAPWITYTMSWCRRPEQQNRFKIAVGSYVEEYNNGFEIIQLKDQSLKTANGEAPAYTSGTGTDEEEHCVGFEKLHEFVHPYPATKVMFAPPSTSSSTSGDKADGGSLGGSSTISSSSAGGGGNTVQNENKGAGGGQGGHTDRDLLITTGDYMRLWAVETENDPDGRGISTVVNLGVLNNNKHVEYCAPLTSFDWNEVDPSIVACCSIDTTCTIWDVETMSPKTQLIAHDKEVYDLAFACGKDIFGTVGADASLRVFDLRSLEHSTILYESPDLSPLLKIIWNKQNPNYLATIEAEGNKAIILDIRVPSIPLVELLGHNSSLNSIAWAPHSANHICTCGDDRQALIWDVSSFKTESSPNTSVGGSVGGGMGQGLGSHSAASMTGAGVMEDPILAFSAEGEINQLQWCSSHEDWVAICFSNSVSILKV
jgi:WD repeat-containing protein 68